MKKANKEYKLYSFDIFDTLITRKVATPKGIFVLMNDIINQSPQFADLPNDVKTNFFNYRTNSEFYLRQINNQWNDGKDISLDMIYNHIQHTYFLTNEQTQTIKELEIQLELDNIIPIKENIEKLKVLLEKGKRVVLISDMYLPEYIVKEMLLKCDPVLCQVKLYLSSTLGFMKTKQALFHYVKEQENVEFREWTHMGDNKFADFFCARKLGIKAVLYPYVKFKEYEKSLLVANSQNSFVQISLGCAKNIRLNKFPNDEKAQLGASLAGPILFPYIYWLLDQAQKRGIERLYFIARDGYILKLIADLIIKENNLPIKTKYIYGSRKAWRISALNLDDDELYRQFIQFTMYEPKKVNQAFGLTKEEFLSILPKNLHNYSTHKPDNRLAEYLYNNKDVLKFAIEKNKAQKECVINYLKNTIDCTDDKFAFVDLDGSGLTQNCLARLMNNFYDKKIKSFYYAVTPACCRSLNLEKYYYYTLKRGNMGNMLELLTRAPHGQTLKYANQDKNFEPILEQIDVENFKAWGFDNYINGMLEYCNLLNQNKYKYIQLDNQVILDIYINYLFLSIDKNTATLLGSIVHTSYGKESDEFAPKLSVFDAFHYLFRKKVDTDNLMYSKARSNKFVNSIIEYRQAHPKFRKELINLYINKTQQDAVFTILGIRISFSHLIWPHKNR